MNANPEPPETPDETPCCGDVNAEAEAKAQAAAAAKSLGLRGDEPARPRQTPLLTKAMRLARSLRLWKKAGAPVVTPEVYQQRLAICEACEHYRANGNFGFGECVICGCSRAKLKLATSRCPDPKGARWQEEK